MSGWIPAYELPGLSLPSLTPVPLESQAELSCRQSLGVADRVRGYLVLQASLLCIQTQALPLVQIIWSRDKVDIPVSCCSNPVS